MFARVGGVLAPVINMLHSHNPTLPLVIFGTSPLVGAVLGLALPETADRPLPDTVEDAENWDSRYHSVCSCTHSAPTDFTHDTGHDVSPTRCLRLLKLL